MWEKMRQMDVDLFEKFWAKSHPDHDMLDWDRAIYEKEWYSEGTFQTYFGMRNLATGLPDGIVREVDDDGSKIVESTFSDGLK